MNRIFIHEIPITTVIGVYAWEREIMQTVIIDIDLDINDRGAGISDNVKDTVDYSEVVNSIKVSMAGNSFYLIEAMAEYLASMILRRFDVKKVKIKITKPGALQEVKRVGIVIERGRSEIE